MILVDDQMPCQVMSAHSPEVVLLPESDPDSEFNTFIAAEIRARVDWTHIHELLKGRSAENVLANVGIVGF